MFKRIINQPTKIKLLHKYTFVIKPKITLTYKIACLNKPVYVDVQIPIIEC